MSPQLTTLAGSHELQLTLTSLLVTRTYPLQSSTDLSDWTEVEAPVAVQTNAVISVTHCPPPAFFRLMWMP